jgi:hypothetical protein
LGVEGQGNALSIFFTFLKNVLATAKNQEF